MTAGISGSMSTNSSTYIVARVSYSETYDVASNTSSVTATLAYRRTNTYAGVTQSTGDFKVNINGTNYTVYSGLFQIPGNDNNWKTVGSKTVTGIAHNANGSKSITIGGSHTGNLSPKYLDFSKSETVALTTIPRASKPTFDKTTVVLDGSDSIVISTNRASSSFTHTLKITVGENTATFTDVGASMTFAPTPSIWMPYMTSYEMTATVACTTYNGTTQIGSQQTSTFTMKVDTATYKPTIGTVTNSDTNTTTSALETSGTFIKGYSNLSMTVAFGINDTGYDSALASAKITIGGVSQTFSLSGTSGSASFTANAITDSTVVIEVTDNRGYKVTQNVALTMINYAPIRITTVTAERCNANGTHSETGTYIKYKVVCNAFRGSFGQVNNSLRVYSSSKLASASTYGSPVLEQTEASSGTGSVQTGHEIEGVTVAGTYSAASQYDIKFQVADALSSATFNAIRVTEGIPVFAWGEDHFDVYGTLHIHDREDITDYVAITPQGGGLSGILKTQWFTSASVSCTANYAASVSINVTVPTGYKYVGVIQTCSNGNIVPCYCDSSGLNNGTVTVWWRNPTGSAMNATFSVNVLFIRE